VEHKEKKRKESILDLSKYLEKNIRVKFAGGREAEGILKGYDPLLNLVLDNTKEYLRGISEITSVVYLSLSLSLSLSLESESRKSRETTGRAVLTVLIPRCCFTDPDDPYKLNQDTRMLGLVVCRGTAVVLICPVDGMEAIPNPFIQQEG